MPFKLNSSAPTAAFAQRKQLHLALDLPALQKDRSGVANRQHGQGSAQCNKSLSLRRAQTVKKYLIALGLKASRFNSVGCGSEQLLAPAHPEVTGNRRVEIRDLGSAAH